MKRIVLLVAVFIATTSFGQGRSDQHRNDNSNRTEDVKLQPPGNDIDVKDKDKDKDKEKPNTGNQSENANNGDHTNNGQGNAYGRNKGDLTGREFGRQRSEEAKKKGEEIQNDDEAQEIIEEVQEENITIINEVESKLEVAREKLEEMRTAGSISVEEYDIKVKRLDDLKSREINLKKRVTLSSEH